LPINGSEPDGISVRRSHHVWIDHVDVSDGADGNVDITNESNFVTVSWSRFWYRDPARAHRFSTLIGSSDTQMQDTGRLKVTMHHNWWADNVVERMPRARYGDVHVFNNYYSSVGNNYCIRSGFNARVLVEGNFFHGVSDPMVLDATGQVVHRANAFEYSNGARAASGDAFEPPYPYQLDNPEELDIGDLVSASAGPPG
jgi:pectate lyase